MSENTDFPQKGELLGEQEVLAQARDILRIARDRIYAASKHRRGRIDVEKIYSILNIYPESTSSSIDFVLDRELDYSLEKRDFTVDYVANCMEIAITRFPHLRMGSSVVSEGVRIRIYKQGKGESFIEYHKKEKNKDGKGIESSPIKNTVEAVNKAIAFVSSI
ncbi:MAG: hypothetical protein ABSD69_02170 [Candidatus Levyibacteriota bacterium]|jgi:hypothetical protein